MKRKNLVVVSPFLFPQQDSCIYSPSMYGNIIKDAENFNIITADLSNIGSLHDRSCELFYQLYGGKVDYGKEHSEKFGHKRFGKSYPPKIKNWNAENPINIVGWSLGGSTAIYFFTLICEDHFGVGTSAEWIQSIVTVSGALNGSTLNYALGMNEDNPDKLSDIPFFSLANFIKTTFISPFLYLNRYIPVTKRIYGFNVDQWVNPSDVIKDHGDNAFVDIAISKMMKYNERFIAALQKAKNKPYLFSISTLKESYFEIFLKKMNFLVRYSFNVIFEITRTIVANYEPKKELYPGFVASMWSENDGIVNTISQEFPFTTSKDSQLIPITDLLPLLRHQNSHPDLKYNHYIKQGEWYILRANSDHIGVTFEDSFAPLYALIASL
jgi:hypothetical protein